MKALVIVAHPDDETIWMGGKIIHEKNWDWTIVSLCRKDDLDRKPKFFKICKELNARAFISDLDDEHSEKKIESLDEVIKRLEPIVHDKKFDIVFTHGESGEYGHNRHVEVNEAVKKMFEEGLLDCVELHEFDYVASEEPFRCEPNHDAEIIFELSEQEFAKKKYLINEVYGFDKGSFEYLSCSAIESSKRVC